jgi:hypothetical protein
MLPVSASAIWYLLAQNTAHRVFGFVSSQKQPVRLTKHPGGGGGGWGRSTSDGRWAVPAKTGLRLQLQAAPTNNQQLAAGARMPWARGPHEGRRSAVSREARCAAWPVAKPVKKRGTNRASPPPSQGAPLFFPGCACTIPGRTQRSSRRALLGGAPVPSQGAPGGGLPAAQGAPRGCEPSSAWGESFLIKLTRFAC